MIFVTVTIPKQIAKDRGIKRYMTGEPCKNGHYTAKWVTDGRCYECAKERVREKYKMNPRLEYRKEYYQRDDVKIRTAEWTRNQRKLKPELYAKYEERKQLRIQSDPVLKEKERLRQLDKAKRKYWKDPESKRKIRTEQYWANPELRQKSIKQSERWRKANPDKYRDLNIRHNPIRRAAKLNRTPAWLTDEDKEQMFQMYKLAKMLCAHVDHIIPLQGKLVSGLHVPSNLQILLPEDNLAKKNRYEIE